MTRPRRRGPAALPALVSVALVAMLAAGCGDDGGGETAASTTTPVVNADAAVKADAAGAEHAERPGRSRGHHGDSSAKERQTLDGEPGASAADDDKGDAKDGGQDAGTGSQGNTGPDPEAPPDEHVPDPGPGPKDDPETSSSGGRPATSDCERTDENADLSAAEIKDACADDEPPRHVPPDPEAD
jgi:hypothetical protein